MSQPDTKRQVEQDAVTCSAFLSSDEVGSYEAPRVEKREKLAEITGAS